jgi:hypothetical protein
MIINHGLKLIVQVDYKHLPVALTLSGEGSKKSWRVKRGRPKNEPFSQEMYLKLPRFERD